MKKLSLYLFLLLMFSFNINASALDFMPANPPVHPEVVYKGVNEEQWKTIDRIGDPLNCRKQVYDLQNISIDDYFQITTDDCLNNENCIKDALSKHDQVMLRKGVYKLPDKHGSIHWSECDTIMYGDCYKDGRLIPKSERKVELERIYLFNQKLIGYPGETIIINAEEAMTAFAISNSILSNLIIQNSKNIGIAFNNNNLVYRVVVGNTGVYFKDSLRGIGFNQTKGVESNCIVSAEAYNGFNHQFNGQEKCKGCDADGFDAKFGANNITFIDVHGHHNSDHGLDFFNGGSIKKGPEPDIRVFYSSGTRSGYNPFAKGGNGAGWKLDGDPQQLKDIPPLLTRLIYGSVSCYNRDHGFSKPGKTNLVFINNSHSESASKRGQVILSGKRYKKYSINHWGNAKTDDPYVLKCKDFRKIKKVRSFDIPLKKVN